MSRIAGVWASGTDDVLAWQPIGQYQITMATDCKALVAASDCSSFSAGIDAVASQ